MHGPVTDNFDWQLPKVDDDEGAWGDVVNAAFAAIDADVQAVKDTADAALPKAGGELTGRVDVKTATIAASHEGAFSGAEILDLTAANYFTGTLNGASSFVFSGVPSGDFATGFILRITNGGAYVITWPASVDWPSGVAPELTESGVDILVFLTDDDGVTWRGMVSGKDIR